MYPSIIIPVKTHSIQTRDSYSHVAKDDDQHNEDNDQRKDDLLGQGQHLTLTRPRQNKDVKLYKI